MTIPKDYVPKSEWFHKMMQKASERKKWKMDNVKCPSCGEISARPELDINKQLEENGDYTCPECKFTTSAWQFDVMHLESKEDEPKTETGVLHPCGGMVCPS